MPGTFIQVELYYGNLVSLIVKINIIICMFFLSFCHLSCINFTRQLCCRWQVSILTCRLKETVAEGVGAGGSCFSSRDSRCFQSPLQARLKGCLPPTTRLIWSWIYMSWAAIFKKRPEHIKTGRRHISALIFAIEVTVLCCFKKAVIISQRASEGGVHTDYPHGHF